MQLISRLLTVSVACVALAASAIASPNVVGTWTGKVMVKMPAVPKAATAEAQKQVDAAKQMVAKMRISLNIRANHTFIATVSGLPNGKVGHDTNEGTWSISGNTLTLVDKKKKGAAGGKMDKPQNLIVSANGKRMTLTPQGGPGTVIFTRP